MKIGWKVLLLLTAFALLAAGCRQESADTEQAVAFQMQPSLHMTEEFMRVLGGYSSGYEGDVCYCVTPQEIAERYGLYIFKFDRSCASFLLYADEVYPLGSWFGGCGVGSFAVADINGDGQWELFFTYSWGSGVHHSQAAYFDTANLQVNVFQDMDFEEELVLKVEDGALFIYTADCDIKSFTDMKLYAREKAAQVSFTSGNIVLLPKK